MIMKEFKFTATFYETLGGNEMFLNVPKLI